MRNRFLLLCIAILLLSVLQSCSPEAPKFEAKDVSNVDHAKGFLLPDFNGNIKNLADFKGKVVIIFFGYTQCPDICPTTLGELVEVKKYLGSDANELQAIFVTVDPARDEAPMLKAYLSNFDPTFVALVPDAEQLKVVAKEYKVFYKKIPGPTPTSYSMDHSAGSYIYDQSGKLRLYARYGLGAEKLAHDIKLLIATNHSKSN